MSTFFVKAGFALIFGTSSRRWEQVMESLPASAMSSVAKTE